MEAQLEDIQQHRAAHISLKLRHFKMHLICICNVNLTTRTVPMGLKCTWVIRRAAPCWAAELVDVMKQRESMTKLSGHIHRK